MLVLAASLVGWGCDREADDPTKCGEDATKCSDEAIATLNRAIDGFADAADATSDCEDALLECIEGAQVVTCGTASPVPISGSKEDRCLVAGAACPPPGEADTSAATNCAEYCAVFLSCSNGMPCRGTYARTKVWLVSTNPDTRTPPVCVGATPKRCMWQSIGTCTCSCP